MVLYSIAPILTASLTFSIVLVSLTVTSMKALSIVPLCIATTIWHGTWAFLFQMNDPDAALRLAKVGHIAILYLPTAVLIAFGRFCGNRAIVLGHLFYVVLLILLFHDLILQGVHKFSFGFYPIAGPFHPLFLLVIVSSIGFSFYKVIRNLTPETSKEEKTYSVVLLISIGIFSISSIDFLINYGLSSSYPIGFAFSCLFSFLMFVSIFRLNLFKIQKKVFTLENQVLAKQKMVTLGELTTGISHQLGNTINTLKVNIAAMEIVGPRSNKDFSELIRSSGRAIDASEKILRGIDFSTKPNAEVRYVNLYKVVESATILSKGKLLERCSVVNKVPLELGVKAYETSLLNVFMNLFSNACDADATEIQVFIENQSVIVSDNGIGIPLEYRDKVFDIFFTTKGQEEGSGIGLGVVRDELNRFRAKIEILETQIGTAFALNGLVYNKALSQLES